MNRFLTVFACLAMIAGFATPAASAAPGVTNTEITIGMSTALSGPASFLGTSFKAGVDAYLSMINASGGVHGRKIRLIAYDDGYEPANTVNQVTKLIKQDQVFCLLGNVGTPTTLAVKPILNEEKVPLFAPFTGAESLRNPVDRYLLHYRASYNQEVEVFIQGVADMLGYRKFAVFYQDDAYGAAVLEAVKLALGKRGMRPLVTGTYTRNLENITKALDHIHAENPDAVVMAGTYSAMAKFIIGWKRQSLLSGKKTEKEPVFMNVSFVGPDRLAQLLDKYGDNVVVTQVVPPITSAKGSARYPAVNEYLTAMQKYAPKTAPSFGSLEGFLATKVFVEVLRRTGRDLNRERFIQTAEGIKDLDIQAGNRIGFSPENHQGSQTVYPTVLRNNTFALIEDWTTLR